MSLLQMSFAGAILILAIIVTRALAINKLPKKTFLALWGVALLRLLIPFSLPSMFSAYSAIERSAPAMQAVQRTPAAKFFPTAPNRMMTTIPSVSDAGTTGMTVSVWAVVWAAGAFACFMFFAISYIRCRREFQTSLPVENEFSTGWLAAHKTGRPITIRQSSGISAPLTAEKWQTRDFGGYAMTNYDASDNAMLEYNFTMTILDVNTLTIREYNNARLGIVNDVPALLQGMSLAELQTDQTAALQPEIDSLAQKYSSDSLKISMQFAFSPLAGYAPDQPANDLTGTSSNEQEPRQNGYGTKEDYASLLALKTPDYQQMTVADFDAAVLDWANEHYDGSERMREDAARNDYQVTLTDEERSFVALTTMLSGEENFRMIQSLKTGRPEENPGVGGTQLWKETGEIGSSAWCSLYYQLPYQIIDKEKLTVGERDRAIGGMINAIQAFWDETPLDDMLKLTQNDVLGEMRSLADEYSSNLITIEIDETQVQFESMDERGINFD